MSDSAQHIGDCLYINNSKVSFFLRSVEKIYHKEEVEGNGIANSAAGMGFSTGLVLRFSCHNGLYRVDIALRNLIFLGGGGWFWLVSVSGGVFKVLDLIGIYLEQRKSWENLWR